MPGMQLLFIAVPVMFQFGKDARAAVATKTFALTFMSAGGDLAIS